MGVLSKLFTDHPASVGESYFEHLAMASSFGLSMLAGGLACLAHGVFPFMFKSTGSGYVRRLHDRMVANRAASQAPIAEQVWARGEPE